MSGSQLITWPMPLTSCKISTFATPLPPPHAIRVTYNEEDPLRRGVMSEYDPAYQTPHFSNASPMHLRSSSAYSDALHIGLCMLHNSTPPPASMPLHLPPLLVCLFVCLPLSLVHVVMVQPPFPISDPLWLPPTPSASTPLPLPPLHSISKAYLRSLCNYVAPTLRLTTDQYWTHLDLVPMPKATIYIPFLHLSYLPDPFFIDNNG